MRQFSSNRPRRVSDPSGHGTTTLAGSIDTFYDRSIAAGGRRVYEALKGVRCLQQRSCWSLALMPSQLSSQAGGLLEELAARPTVADRTRSRIRQELADAAEICAAIDVAAGADNLLYRQVETIAATTELRLAPGAGPSRPAGPSPLPSLAPGLEDARAGALLQLAIDRGARVHLDRDEGRDRKSSFESSPRGPMIGAQAHAFALRFT